MRFFNLSTVAFISLFIISCGTQDNIGTDPLFDVVPNISSCYAGTLSEQEKTKVLTYVNNIRKTHGLPAVEYNAKKDIQQQRAALIGAANAELNHYPSEDDHCYTSDGYQGCSYSNLSLWGSSESDWPQSEIHINNWMTELNSTSIGHRRWILDPFLKYITFGRVIGTPKRGEYKYVSSAAMLIKHDEEADISNLDVEYIAYPQGNNYSAVLFSPNAFLSFSVLADNVTKNNNSSVDFSNSEITVLVGAQELIVKEVSYDNQGYGLPNNIQWKVEGLAKSVIYEVKISNVKVGGVAKDFEYTFSYK